MITMDEGLLPPVLAQRWKHELRTCPDNSHIAKRSFAICELCGRIARVRST